MASVKSRLKASTIAETLAALVILMISFGAGISIYLNVLQGDAIFLHTQAHGILNDLLTETKYQQDFLDGKFEQSGLFIKKEVRPYDNSQLNIDQADLYHIHLQAFDQNKQLIHELNDLIYIPDAPIN